MKIPAIVKDTAKAITSAVVVAAAYLIGVIPAEGGFNDVTTAQWLGLVVFVGGAYGLTYAVPDSATPVRRLKRRKEGGHADATLFLGIACLAFLIVLILVVADKL